MDVEHVQPMTFDAIYYETCEDPAYVNADGSRTDYRDFIPNSDRQNSKKAEAKGETAAYAVF